MQTDPSTALKKIGRALEEYARTMPESAGESFRIVYAQHIKSIADALPKPETTPEAEPVTKGRRRG